MKIVALYGPQGAGKSEAAAAIVAWPRWYRLSFAGPLYHMMSSLLGTDARRLSKTEPFDALCGKTLRQALQSLGTEWGRGLVGDTIWLRAMTRELEHCWSSGVAGVVIDDLRFANEYEFLKGLGAHFVRIEREGCMVPTLNQGHSSELDWHHFKANAIINNTQGVTELRNAAKNMAQEAPHAERTPRSA